MSDLNPKIVQALKGDAAVSALIAGRVYTLTLPQEVRLPAVVVTRISARKTNDSDGYSGLEAPRVQVDCWDKNLGTAWQVARAVRDALLAASEFVAAIAGDRELYEPTTGEYRVSMDFIFWNKEA